LLSAYFSADEEPLKRRNGLKLCNNEPRKDSQFLVDQTSACSLEALRRMWHVLFKAAAQTSRKAQ
jgi:hypothetical protein